MMLQLPVLMQEFQVLHHYICFRPFAKPTTDQWKYLIATKHRQWTIIIECNNLLIILVSDVSHLQYYQASNKKIVFLITHKYSKSNTSFAYTHYIMVPCGSQEIFRNTPNWAHWSIVIAINLIYGEKIIA